MQRLQRRLKAAARSIVRLHVEKEQLQELGNRLRAARGRAGEPAGEPAAGSVAADRARLRRRTRGSSVSTAPGARRSPAPGLPRGCRCPGRAAAPNRRARSLSVGAAGAPAAEAQRRPPFPKSGGTSGGPVRGRRGAAVRVSEDAQRAAALQPGAGLAGRTVVRQRAQQFEGRSRRPGGPQSIPEVEPEEMARAAKEPPTVTREESTRHRRSGSGVPSVKNLNGLCLPAPGPGPRAPLSGNGDVYFLF